MKTRNLFGQRCLSALLGLSLLLLSACAGFGDNSSQPRGSSFRYALVACSDFAGRNSLALIQLKPQQTPRLWTDYLVDLGADPFLDPVVRTADLTRTRRAFVIKREFFSATGLGEVALLDSKDRFQVEFNYPVSDLVNPANPYDLLVLSADKAYVTRWASAYNDILIVNPDTGIAQGTIDFTGRGTNTDGLPRLDKMLYIHGRVWVLMQNINAFFSEYGPGLVGAVDPETDGIEDVVALSIKNPADLGYDDRDNRIYVAATGDWLDPATGGLQAINPQSRAAEDVLISGAALGGFITHMAFKDAHTAYLSVTKSDFSGDKVVRVNPAEGVIGKTLYEYPGLYVSDLALDERQNLVIADYSNSRVVLMDLDTGLIVDTFDTLVPPVSLAIWEGEDKL
jgi:hypothetical protein